MVKESQKQERFLDLAPWEFENHQKQDGHFEKRDKDTN
jgi:hypothetical protein